MGVARWWGTAEDGGVVEVVVKDHLVDDLAARWPPMGLTRTTDPIGPADVRLGLSDEWIIIPGEAPLGDRPPEIAWDLLEQTLTSFTVERMKPLVPVHAAAFAWKGRVVLVPGASGAGKSTLSVAAAKLGATLLTDEYALIDPSSGLVTGWPRPVRLLGEAGDITRLDLATATEPLPVGLVALVRFAPADDGAWGPVSPATAAMEIMEHALSAGSRPDQTLDAALAVARSAPTVQGTRGEAVDAIRALIDLLGRGSDAVPPSHGTGTTGR